jgi:hypothetical protein
MRCINSLGFLLSFLRGGTVTNQIMPNLAYASTSVSQKDEDAGCHGKELFVGVLVKPSATEY